MASKSITIENTLNAINDNIIPGTFNDDHKTFVFTPVRYHNERGDELEWIIEVKLLHEDKYVKIEKKYLETPVYVMNNKYTAEINVRSKQVGGKIRSNTPTIVTIGKNIGKKNETNVITQAFRDALSLYNKQLKKTHVNDKQSRPPPMLLQSLNDSKSSTITDNDFIDGITLQRKFNGIRYVTYLHNNKIIQYSRSCSDFHPKQYLTEELQLLLSDVPLLNGKQVKPYLDGELYLHGLSLNHISGHVRKENDNTKLEYHVFDVFFPSQPDVISFDRQLYLSKLFKNKTFNYIKRVENFEVKNMNEVNKLVKQFISEGYEGGVIRKNNQSYKYSYNNYHSSNVIKIKPIYSSEFRVVDFTEGKKGKDVGKIIWICEIDNPIDPDDATFNVVPNLSLEEREKLFRCLSKKNKFNQIKGLMLTVEYAELSKKTGKPLQPKAVAFRTYESDDDPIKIIFKECGL